MFTSRTLSIASLWLPCVLGLSACGDDGPEPDIIRRSGMTQGGGDTSTMTNTSTGGNEPDGGGPVGSGSTSGSGGTGSNTGGASGGATGSTGGATGGATAMGTGAGAGTGASTGGATGTNPGVPAERLDNPYTEGPGYVNPEWSAKAAAEPGGERVAQTPTAVWLDRTAAIEGTANSESNGPMGLSDHLDAAVDQGAAYAQFVIYNLPGRDCSALASNGELGPDELGRYQSEYIDPIAEIMGRPEYQSLRIINLIEVDSLPNLVTNLNLPACATMQQNGGYEKGVAYALSTLGALPNVYNYVDAGHHGWLGWPDNLSQTAQLLFEVGQMAGVQTVHGFITNSANYSALKEPFFDATTQVNGVAARMSQWVDFNDYVDELSFAQGFRNALVSAGFDSSIGMLIDTSRNGWGGDQRPAAPGPMTDVDSFVEQSRVDRRIHAGNWCNQSGAGMGERPQADPEPGIDAYVWAKPPGESDGSSAMIDNADGKGFDRMCDPTYSGNERNGNSSTGALADAPISGAWFSAQFQELMRNAYPPL